MRTGPSNFWRRRSRLDKAFLAVVVLYALLYVTRIAPLFQFAVAVITVLLGSAVLFRLARRAMIKAIWRLRNRLMAAYLFIAVVPVVLILTLALLTGYVVIGQMAVFLVSRELEHRQSALLRPSEALAHLPVRDPATALNRFQLLTRNSFRDVELLVTGREALRYPEGSQLTHPPPEWHKLLRDGHTTGLVIKEGRLYCWAHVVNNGVEVTAITPLSHEVLAEFVPDLGDVTFRPIMGQVRISKLPPALNAFDFSVGGVYPMMVPAWEAPGKETKLYLFVETRLSAVLGIVFGQKVEWGEQILTAFAAVAILFLLAELTSLVAGINLSRSITGAVHELYEGTQHVKAGDFLYRVPVKGKDQLAELTSSFNGMTEDLGRLLIVAKEKERLESELGIAREVQAQLFPKDVPSTQTLELRGVCQPARSVSGDYYDFVTLPNALAFAIGDVAGKGISAALLMATIQSTMRTQLSVVNGNGHNVAGGLSTAKLVWNLNRLLFNTTAPEKFATFYIGVYDELTRALTYTNAGHLSPLLIRGVNVQPLESTGTVVGAFYNATYEERTVALEPGDLLVAYTDGIVEPENAYGEMYGEQRLQDLLLKYENADSSEIIARSLEAVTHWSNATEPEDDMTMVVVRRI